MVCILNGASVFFTDLIRNVDLHLTTDFMDVSSYGTGTVSSGNVKIIKDLNTDIHCRDVIIVEDILDTGRTLYRLINLLREREPSSMRIAALLDKSARRVVDIRPDYTGYSIPDEFVVGYGLDYNQRYRNLPYVGVLDPKVYAEEDPAPAPSQAKE